MLITIELPDELMARAKCQAAATGISLQEFFLHAITERLVAEATKVVRIPPAIGRSDAGTIGILTPEQIDEAMFG
jgi:hypothetical protein